MKISQALMAGRSHLIFIAAILTASFIILQIEDWVGSPDRPPKSYTLDLQDFESATSAASRWTSLQAAIPDLANAPLILQNTASPGVHARIGPLASKASAEASCKALIAQGQRCTIKSADT